MEEELTVNQGDIDLINDSIRKIPDFPKPGVLFYDLFSILGNTFLTQKLFDIAVILIKKFQAQTRKEFDAIIGLESRGFLLGMVLADRLKLPFVAVRKKNKLPGKTLKVEFITEYSTDTFELQDGVLQENANVLIVDDLLATGGTLKAAQQLVGMAKAEVGGYFVAFELDFLKGRDGLAKPENLITILHI